MATEARERRGRGVRFLGFLEGQLWESFEVWWCPSWNQGWIRLLPVLWIGIGIPYTQVYVFRECGYILGFVVCLLLVDWYFD